MISVYLGLGIGQFLLTLADPEGFELFVAASILFSVALVPVALSLAPAPELPESQAFGFRKLIRISPLGVVGAFGAGLVLGSVYGLAPSYTHAAGFDTTGTAFFMAAILIGGLVLQWPIGRLSDRFDRRKMIAVMALATVAVSIGMMSLEVGDRTSLLIAAVLFGGAVYLLYPLSVTHANDFIPPEELVSASGGLLMAYSVGAVIGPLLASGAMSLMGPNGLFVTSAAAGTLMTVFAVARVVRDRPIPEAFETNFELVPRTSPVAAELDPRGEFEEPELDFEETEKGGP